jgi:hypothetical protein
MIKASDAQANFVAERETYHRLLVEAGLQVEHERDRREFGIESFSTCARRGLKGHHRWSPYRDRA